jgi:hypothetical protein
MPFPSQIVEKIHQKRNKRTSVRNLLVITLLHHHVPIGLVENAVRAVHGIRKWLAIIFSNDGIFHTLYFL